MKKQIQQLLTTQKVTSISDIVCFVIDQVNKTLSQQNFTQIYQRLDQLEQLKGLDSIMIQEVKTITQAMLDQREENLRFDFDQTFQQHIEQVQSLIKKEHLFNHQKHYKPKRTLAQVDILNLMNTNSFNNGFIQQSKGIFLSQKQNHIQSIGKDKRQNDFQKLKQKLICQQKSLSQLKQHLLQITKQLSTHITLTQTQQIIQQFQARMYTKIQKQRIDLQKMEFSIKKQFQDEIFKIRKECFAQLDKDFVKETIQIKRINQKIEKRLAKYVEETKALKHALKTYNKSHQNLQNILTTQVKDFSDYCTLNDSKNTDLSQIFGQINEKLQYFQKIDKLEQQVLNISDNLGKGCWLTQTKTKNDNITWQKQLSNTLPQIFKFQPQKSQIIISQPNLYLMQLSLLQSRSTHLSGSLIISSQSNKRQIKLCGGFYFKTLLEINQKSIISIKLNQDNIGGRAVLKISKY